MSETTVVTTSDRKRLLRGETAVDVWSKRRTVVIISGLLLLLSAISLSTRWLNFGIDFEGGTAFDIPASETFDADDARDVLGDAGAGGSARVETRRALDGSTIKVQIESEDGDLRDELQVAFADAAGVTTDDVSVATVSASWSDDVSAKALIALGVLLVVVAGILAMRYDWRMAVGAFAALLHDLVITAGVYSIFGFEVTPATAVAFGVVIGYSLYDSVVVFDRIRENEKRVVAAGLSAVDLVNVSTNQVLTRSIVTSLAAILPLFAIGVVSIVMLGQSTMRDIAIVLLVGIIVSAYSSLFIATPILGWLKGAGADSEHWAEGESLRQLVTRGITTTAGSSKRQRGRDGQPRGGSRRRVDKRRAGEAAADGVADDGNTDVASEASTEQVLQHPPRPRKKKRH